MAATDNARPPRPALAVPSTPVVQAPKAQPRIISSAPRAPSVAVPSPVPSPVERRPGPQRNEPTPSVASTSRPMIKLKVGSQSKVLAEPIERASENTKPPKRKSKPSELPTVLDAPPPPYVDDGSHDILQEVLAIEREKNEQRHRGSDRERAESATSSGKRRKLDVEEDILALAVPLKKERPTPPGPSNNVKTHKSSPVSTPKPSEPPAKPKKDRLVDSSRSSMSIDQPLPPSLKGKEREISKPSPASTPVPSAPQNKPRKPTQATPINVKKCKELMKVLYKLPESGIFLRPVDVVLDGCPT